MRLHSDRENGLFIIGLASIAGGLSHYLGFTGVCVGIGIAMVATALVHPFMPPSCPDERDVSQKGESQ